jgi:hypothetical protein
LGPVCVLYWCQLCGRSCRSRHVPHKPTLGLNGFPGPISGPSGGRSVGPLPECAKRVGKGERAARTICQWQIVRPERTARKRRAGRLLAQGPGNPAAPSLRRGEPRPTDMTVDDRQAIAHPAQARGRVAGAVVGAVPRLGAGHIRQQQQDERAYWLSASRTAFRVPAGLGARACGPRPRPAPGRGVPISRRARRLSRPLTAQNAPPERFDPGFAGVAVSLVTSLPRSRLPAGPSSPPRQRRPRRRW